MRVKALLSLLFIVLAACNTNTVYTAYKPIAKAQWHKDSVVSFTITPKDTIQHHNLFVHIRNNETYAYSNLFLIVSMNFPDGNTVVDTLEYAMAKPNGEWLGTGVTSVKENKLWYKENIIFPTQGEYKVSISHAMRKKGAVKGIEALQGITDVGFEIEKSEE